MAMDIKLEKFQELSALFVKHGFSLYLVGGTVRDYLLNISLTDMDAVTDATPNDIKGFLDADFTFEKYGSVRYKVGEIKFDITTLREEGDYIDKRHPQKIKFVKDLSIDVKRRDFTINGLYLSSKLEVIDLVDGKKDLNNHLLRCIGEADKRIKEDPLRIIRAIRFAIDYDLSLEKSLNTAIIDNLKLLESINPEKIRQDMKKMKTSDKKKIIDFLNKFNIASALNVIE